MEETMFDSILFFILVSTTLVFCKSAFVDNLSKCNINDGDCERDLIQSVLQDIAKTGVPELEIPAIDPITIKNVTISVLDILNITFVEGTLKGIKDCKVEKFHTNVEEERASMELFCDTLHLKGKYKADSSSSVIKTLLQGETVHGEGNTKINMEKIHLRFDYYFYVQRRDDDIYIKCKMNETVYKYDIGEMTFHVDNLYIGTQDASQLVTILLNQNWKLLKSSFGKAFMDTAMGFVYTFVHNFVNIVPTKYYISNDLSEYAKP